MKNIISLIACIIIGLALLQYRVTYSDLTVGKPPLKVTEWDAFGYYVYLPSIFIYHDVKELNWLAEIDKKYGVTGGNGYQAQKLDNGNYVFKYLGGVAIMEIPLFFIGHWMAIHYGYPPDGFSPPYQYALGFGVIFYCLLAVFLLRKILLYYFGDLTAAVTLLLVCLATNFIQYAAIDNGQSHGYIFPLYVIVLYVSHKWHQKPKIAWAALMGYIIGLAMISRPTEAIMLLIPLLWNTQTKEAAKEKWALVRQYKKHFIYTGLFGLIGILPQLIYWKITTGSFVYDVGSKWEFLSPHFRVLFGWEKGWFIYTPVTILFIIGMFFIKRFPFKKSVLWFCFLNIYIIIAWHDWRYGGSYSTRALMQSYPVFALPLGALLEKVSGKKWRPIFYLGCAYLIGVNLFQITQYCNTILHYDHMNRAYYGRIYLNPHPTPIDMSLLDNDEVLNNESDFRKKLLVNSENTLPVHFAGNAIATIIDTVIMSSPANSVNKKDTWLKIESSIKAENSLWLSYLDAELKTGDSIKHSRVRLFSPICKNDKTNQYAFYMHVPEYFLHSRFKLYISSPNDFNGTVEKIVVTQLDK
jgi:hypothetical protein